MLLLQILCSIYILFMIFMGIASLKSGSRFVKGLQDQGKRASRLHNFEFTKGIFFLLVTVVFLFLLIGISLPTNPQALWPSNMPAMGLGVCLTGVLFILMGVQLPYLTYLALYKQSEEVGEDAKKWEKAPLSVYVMIGAGVITMGLPITWIGVYLAFFMAQIGTDLGLPAGVPFALVGLASILFLIAFIRYLRDKARDAQHKFAGEREEKQRSPA